MPPQLTRYCTATNSDLGNLNKDHPIITATTTTRRTAARNWGAHPEIKHQLARRVCKVGQAGQRVWQAQGGDWRHQQQSDRHQSQNLHRYLHGAVPVHYGYQNVSAIPVQKSRRFLAASKHLSLPVGVGSFIFLCPSRLCQRQLVAHDLWRCHGADCQRSGGRGYCRSGTPERQQD